MKKVWLMVRDSDRREALLKLREAGLVHLQTTNVLSESGSVSFARKNKIENAIGLLSEIKANKRQETVQTDSSHLLETVIEIGKERKELQERIIFINREIARIESWGELNPASVKELSKHLPVFLYELPADLFADIPEDARYIKVSKNKSNVKIIVLDRELPSDLMPGITPFRLPEKSLSAFFQEIADIKIKLNDIGEKLKTLASGSRTLLEEKAIVEQEIEYEHALSSMETVVDTQSEYALSYITGYVPCEDMDCLKKSARENFWALSSDDPEETDEKVPTKLKNSKLVNLLTPVTDFLGIVPGYREVDISLWFLLFFCIFFAMIFGDAGYGIILLLIAAIGIIKTSKNGVPQGMQLLLLLGACTTTWGVFTCSWFGLEVEKLPQLLKDISLPAFSPAKTGGSQVDQNLQLFCFSLGLIHLTIARVKNIIKNIGSPRVLSEIGNLAMLWGMFNVVLFLVVSRKELNVYPLLPASIYLLCGGFALYFVFGSYEKSVGQSVLDSTKNLITVVLGIPGIFSDIMSYIRLWAVALAGASIASTVNLMAGPLLGNFLIFAGILLLFLGHGFNLVLNIMSVLVHGVRLNTLEFSGHADLRWSGTAYRPFAQRTPK